MIVFSLMCRTDEDASYGLTTEVNKILFTFALFVLIEYPAQKLIANKPFSTTFSIA